MTPLGSADGSQERVRVVAVGEAINIAGGDPGSINIKYESKLTVIRYYVCAAYHPPVC